MQRGSANRHRARDHAVGRLVGDEITRPLILTVVEAALPVLKTVVVVEELRAGFDDDDFPRKSQTFSALTDVLRLVPRRADCSNVDGRRRGFVS